METLDHHITKRLHSTSAAMEQAYVPTTLPSAAIVSDPSSTWMHILLIRLASLESCPTSSAAMKLTTVYCGSIPIFVHKELPSSAHAPSSSRVSLQCRITNIFLHSFLTYLVPYTTKSEPQASCRRHQSVSSSNQHQEMNPRLMTTALNSQVDAGTMVAPGVLAPYHQHLFSLRIDPAVDGHSNAIQIEESVPMHINDRNRHAVGYTTKSHLVEQEGFADIDPTQTPHLQDHQSKVYESSQWQTSRLCSGPISKSGIFILPSLSL